MKPIPILGVVLAVAALGALDARAQAPAPSPADPLPSWTAREYAYGPATGLPDNKVGTFPQALLDEAKKQGWVVISMKNDWKRVFAFEGTTPASKD